MSMLKGLEHYIYCADVSANIPIVCLEYRICWVANKGRSAKLNKNCLSETFDWNLNGS